ncbi:MAG: acyltransferase [Pseudodesulfovibrio sp.]
MFDDVGAAVIEWRFFVMDKKGVSSLLKKVLVCLIRFVLDLALWCLMVLPTSLGIWLRRVIYTSYMDESGRFFIWENVLVTGFSSVRIGEDSRVSSLCRLYGHDGILHMGQRCSLAPNVQIGAAQGEIYIGDDVSIGPNTVIRAGIHKYDRLDVPINSQGHRRTVVRIEDDVWIASNVVVSGGVTLGKGCVVAAGSVVTRDVEPYAVVAGVPAKIIKRRG